MGGHKLYNNTLEIFVGQQAFYSGTPPSFWR